MKVALIASYAPSLVNFRGPLITELAQLGHDVLAIAPDLSDTLKSELAELGASAIEIPLARNTTGIRGDLDYRKNLTRILKAHQVELAVTYTIKPNIWGAFAAKAAGARSVAMVTGLGFVFTETEASGGLKHKVLRGLVSALYRRATRANELVIFQNPDDRDDFIAAGCLADPGKVRMVNGSGVDLSAFTPAPLPDAPVFLMVARLLRNKGVREYCEAATRVKETLPDARFLLVGPFDPGTDGIDAEELAEWQDKGVEYLGPSDDVRQELAMASVFVLPSYREGTPRSVLEAMAMGRAVITSDAPGCRETVEDGVSGFLCPVRDVDTLTERMMELATDATKRQKMGAEGLRLVKEKYDVVKVNAALIAHLGLNK